MKVNELQNLCIKVRYKFETEKIYDKNLGKLYLEYNSVQNIETFVRKARSLFPRLNCGLASVYLSKLIPGSVICQGKFKGNNHTLLRINNYVIDITADQYGGPKVYVGSLRMPWQI